MIKVDNTNIYKAFGFSIMSEIPLPQLPQLGLEVDSNIDIVITKKDLTKKWIELVEKDNVFVIQENLMMYKFWDIAIFAVQDGKRISVSPLKEYDEDTAGIIILGTCMGAVLMQRKVLPLHGSAIAINGKAYAIVGDSGAGKSTLALAFIERGFRLLTDDVIAVSLKDDIPYVTPSYPQQKLWRDSLNSFGIKTDDYKSLLGRENKFCVPVSSNFITDPLPLAGVVELVKTDSEDISIRTIENLKRFYTFYYHTYRNFFIQRSGLMDWHFQTSAKILKQIDMYQLQRPNSGFSASQLVSKILTTINKGEE
ncbi:aldolase [Niallia oryzisoli]|uniref:Aldolase n=1 Tax=Niallia oryzisoli TaxID=1737571 RepID=A0ABZ2CCR2_9BACI